MKKAFTLVELLIVIIIIGILATMAVPQYNKMVEKAKWSEAVSVLGSIKQAVEIYIAENSSYPLVRPSENFELINGSNSVINYGFVIDIPSIDDEGRFLYAV